MKRIFSYLVLFIFIAFPLMSAAQQSSGGGGGGLKGDCEMSGGTFTGSETGNWACCWPDWGCYGCVDGNCKVKCNTARCRNANGMAAQTRNQSVAPVKGLAPTGTKDPLVPIKYFKSMKAAP